MRQRWRNGRVVGGIFFGLIAGALVFQIGRKWRMHWLEVQAVHMQYAPAPPGMVFVPAGEFLMGSDDADAEPDERPLRKVFVPAFYIDKFEVTNRRFKEFKKDYQYPEGDDDLPATLILKSDAEAYCRWLGKRLPTRAEWEKAARGTDGRRFPWGNDFNPGGGNFNVGTNGSVRGLTLGGSFPTGASPYGVQDMSGNVWEWVADIWSDPSYPGLTQPGEKRGIVKGGAHGYSAFQARASYQGFEALDSTCHDVGFRCAMDAKPLQ